MSNLGMYQVFSTEAKQHGGVEGMLAAVGDAAVAEQAPAIFWKGVEVGAGFAVLTLVAVRAAQVLKDRRRARRVHRIEEGAQARAELLRSSESGAPVSGFIPWTSVRANGEDPTSLRILLEKRARHVETTLRERRETTDD